MVNLWSASLLDLQRCLHKTNEFGFVAAINMNEERVEKRVWFPGWAEVLAGELWPAGQREVYRRLIAWYLHECKQRRWAVSVASARRFIEMVERERQSSAQKLAVWKEALN